MGSKGVGGVCVPGTLRDGWRVLEKEHLPLWELCEGKLKGLF